MGGDELAILLQTSKSISVHLKLVWDVVINELIDKYLDDFLSWYCGSPRKILDFLFSDTAKVPFLTGLSCYEMYPCEITSYRITYSEPPKEWLSFQ